jgi:D-alanine-D-alanine ligase-like ATP-grasp enzyme
MDTKGKTIVGKMLEKIAPRIGAEVLFEPWGYAGQIAFKGGKKAYFRGSSIGLNTIAAADIAKDKDFSNFFMQKMGYRTIPGGTFFRDDWALTMRSTENRDAALLYAKELGFPLIVKPNSGSQGRGVARVDDVVSLTRALNAICAMDRVFLVQKLVQGKDYRLVVLDDRIISAYERIPLNVTGDGMHSVLELLKIKQEFFNATERDTKIDFEDPRIEETLQIQGLALSSIPGAGTRTLLLTNANLSSGGDAVDVTHLVTDSLKNLCVQLTRDMGLRLCGVDLMLKGGIEGSIDDYYILEINAAPGLDHYANIGEKQNQVVEDLYVEILKSMEV